MCSIDPFQFRWLKRYTYCSCYYHHQIGSIHLSHCYHIFPWLCVWDVCYIIFCHILHIHSGKTGILFSSLLCSLWWLQIVGYVMASKSYSAISQSGCNVRGHCSPKIFCLFCLIFNCIQIALLLGHIHVKLQSTVFHIKEIIEEYLRLHWWGYGRDNLSIYLKWISFCGKNISFVHILFLFYWN